MRNTSERRFGLRLAVIEIGRNVCFMGGDTPDTSGQNEAAKVNAEIAKEMWGEYQNTYLPMERQFAQEANNYDTVEKRAEQAGLATADVTSAFANQREQSTRNLESMGIDPSSGAWANQDSKLRLSEASAQAGAQNKARQNVENMGYARKQDAISIGKGMPGQASASMSAAGNQYGQIANAQLQQDQNQASSVGNTVGGAAALYGMMKADGGYVEEDEQKLAGGGMAGNPRMQAIIANNNPSMPMSRPGLSPEVQAASDGIKTYKNVKKIKGMYDSMTAKPVTQGDMLAAQADGFGAEGAASTFESAGAGAEQSALLAEQTAGMESGTALTTDALGTAGATTAATGATTAAGGAAAADLGLMGGTSVLAAEGAAAATGGAAAAAPLAAMGPVGWAALAGMGLYALSKKDGGEVEAPGDAANDQETPAEERREARADLSKGGMINGAGTETSDSIPAQAPSGSYILNAETVKMLGKGLTKSKVPLRVSKNELAVPPELVRLMGKDKLDQANQAGLDARYGLSRGRA